MKKSSSFRKIFLSIFCTNILGMVVFVCAVVFGGLWLIDGYTLHGEFVEMPNLKGENAKVAVRKLESLGLKGEVNDTGYVERMAGGVILDQSIRPGDKIKPGRWIYLAVNSTEERRVALPTDIAGNCSMREAEMKLKARGFRIAPPEYILGDRNWVYEIKVNGKVQEPGSMVSVRTPLTLVVGDGQVEEEYSGGDDFYESAFTDSLSGNTAKESEGDALFE